MEGTVSLAPILATLGTMLALSVAVERILELFSGALDPLWALRDAKRPDGAAKVARRVADLERAMNETERLTAPPEGTDDNCPEIETNPAFAAHGGDEGAFEPAPLSPKNPGTVMKEFYLQLIGVLLAVVICKIATFSAWPLLSWSPQGGWSDLGQTPAFWEYLLTGIIIAGGSKPIHLLMKFLIERKVTKLTKETDQGAAAEKALARPAKEPAPAAAPSVGAAAMAGFVYNGGHRPERLEYTHQRRVPVDLIVYHHTAMHADAPFDAIVREFERKGWLTGYHAVVLRDGTIRFICRWDRVGNHARGVNHRSLGLAFQGNFEPNPEIPFGNPDGRLGPAFPSPEQLDAGARMIAFWSLLYGVPPVFPHAPQTPRAAPETAPTGIAPHCFLANKACPGSAFPHDSFKSAIAQIRSDWENDPDFQAALTRFKATPMILWDQAFPAPSGASERPC